ncbi:hypothetical protein GQ53DRAFT_265514 [Thozetella sp. PMI_491]|nr:hypothetical protein GQ53DRAFT_265514 [Thozetella sp. PMI_491]
MNAPLLYNTWDVMNQPVSQAECTFINVTENPAQSREARRNEVRRTVMRNYHRRRKREGKPRLASASSQPTVPAPTCGADTNPVAFSMPLASLEPRSATLFQPKKWSKPHHAQIGRLIIHYLCGQTWRAGHDLSQVAFVHQYVKNGPLILGMNSNPLKVCGDVLRSFEHATLATPGGSHDDLWIRIHHHQEQLYSQCESLGQWELLSAAQALCLYILLWIRASNSQSRFACGNIALLFTLGKTFKLLQSRYLHVDPHGNTLRPVCDWDSWVFRESCIRLASLYFILTIVVSMDIGWDCTGPTDWRIQALPVPAPKAVWDADNEPSWTIAIASSHSPKEAILFGDIIGHQCLPNPQRDIWEEGVDEMGLIVGMAGGLYSDMIQGERAS